MLSVELEYKISSEILFYLNQYISFSPFSKNFSFDLLILRKCILFQNVTNKENCVSCHYLLKLGGCLTANLLIYNRIVNVLLKAVVLKPLSGWVPNLARLFLNTKGTFSPLKSVKSEDVIQFCAKNLHLVLLCMEFLPHTMEKEIVYQVTTLRKKSPYSELSWSASHYISYNSEDSFARCNYKPLF